MYPPGKPMCQWDNEEFEPGDYGDYEDKDEYDGGTGTTTRVTRYRDGSAVHHFGGPVGDVRTAQYGEEC